MPLTADWKDASAGGSWLISQQRRTGGVACTALIAWALPTSSPEDVELLASASVASSRGLFCKEKGYGDTLPLTKASTHGAHCEAQQTLARSVLGQWRIMMEDRGRTWLGSQWLEDSTLGTNRAGGSSTCRRVVRPTVCDLSCRIERTEIHLTANARDKGPAQILAAFVAPPAPCIQ